jgi:hypothetical protein
MSRANLNIEKWAYKYATAIDLALQRMAQDTLTVAKQNVPYDTGALQHSGQVSFGGKTIAHSNAVHGSHHHEVSFGKTNTDVQAYASIQENTQFGNYTTPGTGPHFLSNAANKVFANAMNYLKQAAR